MPKRIRLPERRVREVQVAGSVCLEEQELHEGEIPVFDRSRFGSFLF